MTEIVPAVLAENFQDLNEKIAKYENIVSSIQIDVCDGNFVPSTSWPVHSSDEESIQKILNEEDGMPYWDKIDFEFDLMVKNAHTQFEFFVRLGAKKIIFHLEAEDDLVTFKEFLEGLDIYFKENIEIALAINTTTPIDSLEPFINNIDFVQCMGIEKIGFQGENFDDRVLNQIRDLRMKYLELIISVDGGVNENTAPLLIKAGANRLVIGSVLKNSLDIRETINYFENL